MEKWGFYLMFIFFFLGVYFLLNFYFYKKLVLSFGKKRITRKVLTYIFLIIFLAFASQRMFSLKEGILISFINFFVYYYLTYLFLFLIVSEIQLITMFFLKRIKACPKFLNNKFIFKISFSVAFFIVIYGSFEANNIVVKEITINTNKILANKVIKVVQISDVHFSSTVGLETAKRIKKVIEKISPDLLVSTGDLIDRNVRQEDKVIEVLKSIRPPLGKIAITGNHEFYTGIKKSLIFTEASGFQVLRNNIIRVEDNFVIAGVDDKAIYRLEDIEKIIEKDIFKNSKDGDFIIYLKHRPKVDKGALEYFDLQLSGHTHNGQIFPFTVFVRMVFSYMSGLYDLEDGKKIYVNQGTGTWGPTIRFLAAPEITLINIRGAY